MTDSAGDKKRVYSQQYSEKRGRKPRKGGPPVGSVYKQRGKWYWYKVRLPGDKKYSAFPCCPPGAKTATTNKTLALAIAQRIYKEKYLANPAPKLDSLLEEFKEKELRRNTRTYVVDKISTLKDFFSVANISAPLDISAPLVRDYLSHLETLGKAAKTVNNKRASISRFCRVCESAKSTRLEKFRVGHH